MEKDKTTISQELDHIKNSINQKNDIETNDNNFILLDKIVSKGKKYDEKKIIRNKLSIFPRISVGFVNILERFSGSCFKKASMPETINKAAKEKIIKFNI